MKQLAMAFSVATLAVAATPASAAIIVSGTSQANATVKSVTLDPITSGGGAYASGSYDLVSSAAGAAARFFKITYNFATPVTGTGSFDFQTSSSGNALLSILGFSTSGSGLTPLSSTTSTLNGVTTTKYSGVTPIALVAGQSQSFTLLGSIVRTGSLTTNVSFAAAVPEAATWAMMMIGIGMVGAALRVRRRQVRFQTA